MTTIKRFNFSNDKQITVQIADSLQDFLWIGFAQNSDGICIIEKSAKFSPTQTYFSLEREVDKIVAMAVDSNNLYLAYTDSALLGERISKNNPLTSTTSISKGAIIESPIDVKIDGTNLWYLLPGTTSGENSKLLRYNTSGVLQQTVDLIGVNEATSMAIDANNDIWIVTYENPVRLIRVFEISGGLYDYEITEIS